MHRAVLMLSERKSEASWKKSPPPPSLPPPPGPWAGAHADSTACYMFMQYTLLHPCVLTIVPILVLTVIVCCLFPVVC